MDTGAKLSKLRRENNYTQEQFADMLGVSRQAVSKWENGTAYPETDKLLKISGIFGCSIDYLLKDEENKEESKVNGTAFVKQQPGRIFISSYDNKSVGAYCRVEYSKIFAALKDEPHYILYGIDSVSFWGSHKVMLGWYETLQDIEKEIADITKAISNGESSYKLKYNADIETAGIFKQPKLKKYINPQE